MLKHKGTQTIQTQRLILRKVCMEDVCPMFRNWASDPEVTKFLTWPPHECREVTKAVVESWIDGYRAEDYYQWIIVWKQTDLPVGSISVVHQNDRVRKAEIGYCLGKEWWNQGIMTEALQAVMDFLFDEVGMNRVEARHDPNNPGSGAVMRKCGMRLEGTLRQSDRNNQGICDSNVYALLAQERKRP